MPLNLFNSFSQSRPLCLLTMTSVNMGSQKRDAQDTLDNKLSWTWFLKMYLLFISFIPQSMSVEKNVLLIKLYSNLSFPIFQLLDTAGCLQWVFLSVFFSLLSSWWYSKSRKVFHPFYSWLQSITYAASKFCYFSIEKIVD